MGDSCPRNKAKKEANGAAEEAAKEANRLAAAGEREDNRVAELRARELEEPATVFGDWQIGCQLYEGQWWPTYHHLTSGVGQWEKPFFIKDEDKDAAFECLVQQKRVSVVAAVSAHAQAADHQPDTEADMRT